MKRKGPVNDHERLFSAFSRYSLGSLYIFHPNLYNGNKEPADMAFMLDRTIVLFNLTERSRSFEQATKHNLNQLQKQIRLWKEGKYRLSGRNEHQEFDLAYDDVDNIIAVSVLGGKCRSSLIHDIDDQWQDKVAAVVTIADDMLLTIAKLGGGIRDILHAILVLAKERKLIDTRTFSQKLRASLLVAEQAQIDYFYKKGLNIRIPRHTQERMRTRSNCSDLVKLLKYAGKPEVDAPDSAPIYERVIELDAIDLRRISTAYDILKFNIENVPIGKLGIKSSLTEIKNRDFSVGVIVSRTIDTPLITQAIQHQTEERWLFVICFPLDTGGAMIISQNEERSSALTRQLEGLRKLLNRQRKPASSSTGGLFS